MSFVIDLTKGYTLDCFIIKRKNYREADKLITVFSKQRGKVLLKAKSIRKINSRRLGALELFNRARIQVVKGKGDVDVITEVELTRDHAVICQDFHRTKIAYELLELINTFAPEEVENDTLFELLEKALGFVTSDTFCVDLADKTSLRFKSRILELLGYGTYHEPTHAQLNTVIEDITDRKLVAHHNFSI